MAAGLAAGADDADDASGEGSVAAVREDPLVATEAEAMAGPSADADDAGGVHVVSTAAVDRMVKGA